MPLESIAMTSLGSTTTWEAANELVGKLVTAMANVSIATLISDNNPTTATARVAIYKIGTSNHYLKLYAQAKTPSIGASVLKLDGATDVYPDGTYTHQYQSPLNKIAYILHSSGMLMIYMNGTRNMVSSSNQYSIPVYIKTTAGDWISIVENPTFSDGSYAPKLFFNVNDTSGGDLGIARAYGAFYANYDYQGNYFPLKNKFLLGAQIQGYEPIGWYSVGGPGLSYETMYKDANNNYWFYYYGYYSSSTSIAGNVLTDLV